MTYNIRRPQPKDAEQIARAHIQAWQETYTGMMPEAHLASLGATLEKRMVHHATAMVTTGYYVVEESGKILGFICYGQSRDNNDPAYGEIYAINLLNAAKGRGIAQEMMRRAFADLAAAGNLQISLWVVDKNTRACSFYEKMGGVLDGQVKKVEIGGQLVAELRYVWNIKDV